MPDIKPKFGIVIVGDELLSGKRQDGHFNFMIAALKQRGGQLSWARVVEDSIEQQAQVYRETRASGAIVFSFGGIGATPDDLSRAAAAQAFKRPLAEHPRGIKLLQHRFANDLNSRRRQLVHFPQGAEIIPNPVNQVPGFSLLNHYFVPGFPNMAHPMVEWVLDTYFSNCFDTEPDIEQLLQTQGVYESELIPVIEEILQSFPELKISCLPNSRTPGKVELGIKGKAARVNPAVNQLRRLLDEATIDYRHG